MRWRIALLVCLLVAYPPAFGVAGTEARIAFLGQLPRTDPEMARVWNWLADGLRQRGWVEGKNLTVTFDAAGAGSEGYGALAAELVDRQPDLIIAVGPLAVRAVQERTRTIPIVMYGVPDPVNLGFVASMAHPGGNLTGVSPETEDVFGKGVQLLTELRPGMTRIAYLGYGADERYWKAAQELFVGVAQQLHLAPWMTALRVADDLEPALAAVAKLHPDALVVSSAPLLQAQTEKIAAFAIRERLLTSTFSPLMVHRGLLLAYHADFHSEIERVAAIVDKVLRGAKPAEIPVEQPTKFDLSINLKTALAISLDIPTSLRTRADDLIQ